MPVIIRRIFRFCPIPYAVFCVCGPLHRMRRLPMDSRVPDERTVNLVVNRETCGKMGVRVAKPVEIPVKRGIIWTLLRKQVQFLYEPVAVMCKQI